MSKNDEDIARLEYLSAVLDEAGDQATAPAESDLDSLRGEVEQAWLTVRKRRLVTLRHEIDRERLDPRVIPFDRAAMRKKLTASIRNDPEMLTTLAARGAIDDLEDDLDGLLEDFAALEQDGKPIADQ